MSNIIWVLIIRLLTAGVEAPVEEFDTKDDCSNKARKYLNISQQGHIAAYCKPMAKTQEAR